MPSLDDVYMKFGEAAEAAQIIETNLGNKLILARLLKDELFTNNNPERSKLIFEAVERATLGQLLNKLGHLEQSTDALYNVLSHAVQERNRLFHSFYEEHNFRRNSEEGRAIMMRDLMGIHSVLLVALESLLKLDGVDVTALSGMALPTSHVPLRNKNLRTKAAPRPKRVH